MAFDALVHTRAPALHRSAYLLTGDWALAQDLVQHALAVTWTHWSRLTEPDAAEAYVRRVMARTATSWWRRKWRGEISTAVLPDTKGNDPYADVDDRAVLREALAALSPRQRAVVVLRFYEDLPESAVADLLGWPIGTVKSTCARALARLQAGQLAATEPGGTHGR